VDAVNNARAAMEIMVNDIKSATMDFAIPDHYFFGIDSNLGYGDGIDNDGDGDIDEETFNGTDDDGDWTMASNNHAVILDLVERSSYTTVPDLGDFDVDEDLVFGQDTLEFRIKPNPALAEVRDEIIKYEIGTFEGENNVLLKQVSYMSGTIPLGEETMPVAFDVLSLSFLYFDPNGIDPGWKTTWDASNAPSFPLPGIELPVTVYINVTVYSGIKPLNSLQPGDEIETTTMGTAVNIEQVLWDPRYQALVGGR
jgi:hypothetical protein